MRQTDYIDAKKNVTPNVVNILLQTDTIRTTAVRIYLHEHNLVLHKGTAVVATVGSNFYTQHVTLRVLYNASKTGHTQFWHGQSRSLQFISSKMEGTMF